MAPATTNPSESSVVATGRRTKGLDRLIKNAIAVVAGELLSPGGALRKSRYVMWRRHIGAAIA